MFPFICEDPELKKFEFYFFGTRQYIYLSDVKFKKYFQGFFLLSSAWRLLAGSCNYQTSPIVPGHKDLSGYPCFYDSNSFFFYILPFQSSVCLWIPLIFHTLAHTYDKFDKLKEQSC